MSMGFSVSPRSPPGVASPLSFGVNASASYNAQWSQSFGTDAAESVSSVAGLNGALLTK